jgi:hypothetical protein
VEELGLRGRVRFFGQRLNEEYLQGQRALS